MHFYVKSIYVLINQTTDTLLISIIGDLQKVKELVAKGANIDARVGYFELTPLASASEKGNFEWLIFTTDDFILLPTLTKT